MVVPHQLNYGRLWVKLPLLRVSDSLEGCHDFVLFNFILHTQYVEALLTH